MAILNRLTQWGSIALLALCLTSPAVAEQKQQFGAYEVHYNAFNSTFLQPDIASQYHLVRSKERGLLNIAVLKDGKPGKTMISGSVKNLAGQRITLTFQEITEPSAVYYLSDFTISNDDTLEFSITVRPDPQGAAHELHFTQTFFRD
ncbi:DUF4426 domain-containing protein [Pokkaliibacter sp. MBI-7]|uniref:DUF4426 domain-containing protein n=1 Tax=Pokkaliibacter sp. MBI-7 TaxID=3040600 RepID=UPI002449C1BC|nr:DUF4426 domain-containing protein [Pokkaliibacter sp. MBI-7]MDH2432878.1 DUF4426 domain-containing protein [Pokkaliibacter sp. MBI-7]